MPRGISARSTTRVRRIFPTPKSKRGRTRRLSFRKFHRDAGQDRVARVSREKETGSLPRSSLAGNLSPALHHGHLHPHSLFPGRSAGANSRPHGLCWHHPYCLDRSASGAPLRLSFERVDLRFRSSHLASLLTAVTIVASKPTYRAK